MKVHVECGVELYALSMGGYAPSFEIEFFVVSQGSIVINVRNRTS